jgi:sulfate adenylyltransferase
MLSSPPAMARNKSPARKSPASRGAALLITGYPAAGKTTLARALSARIEKDFGRAVSLLDGDEVRRLLSSELGYTREHRQLNCLRHAYIAAEACRHGGLAVCAMIAPYAADRAAMRQMVTKFGSFIEIHLSTPLVVCEQRDPKGLYARARAGKLTHMTGVDDPYEAPQKSELTLDGSRLPVERLVEEVVGFLIRKGLVRKQAVKRRRR